MCLAVALDLEGTLISNAISAFPRHGLRAFIEAVLNVADRVVMFTTVREDRARELLQILESENCLPAGFAAAVEFVPYSGRTNDLSAVGEPAAATVLLVDDQPSMVHPRQEANWVQIAEFTPPFDREDHEFERIVEVIRNIRDDITLASTISGRTGESSIPIKLEEL